MFGPPAEDDEVVLARMFAWMKKVDEETDITRFSPALQQAIKEFDATLAQSYRRPSRLIETCIAVLENDAMRFSQ